MVHQFSRTEMLIGPEALYILQNSKVAIFGVGGVGSFAVEGLARAGVGNFVLIDHDYVCLTNINRQIHATSKTVGMPKVEVMRERVLEINPKASVEVFKELYCCDSAERLLSSEYSYVVDAIDMVSAKVDLIDRCSEKGIPIISSMGTGNKMNPTMLEVTDIYSTSVCPLARVVRRELKKRGVEKLKVVYSKEKPLVPREVREDNDPGHICSSGKESGEIWKKVPGSISFVPSVAGLIIASEVVKELINYTGGEGWTNHTL